jgi:uncharacterized protein (TIGR02271 family)
MQDSTPIVTGKDGLRGELVGSPDTRREGTCELVLQDGRRVVVPAELLQARSDGSFYLPLSPSELEGIQAASTMQEGIVIPLAREQLAVGKRKVQTGGVRVSTHVREHEEVVDVPLEREEVDVERVEVGRVVEVVPEVRREGDTLIVPLVEEVLVVEKRLVLREEVRVTTRRSQTHQPQRVTLRSEEAEIERIAPASSQDQA